MKKNTREVLEWILFIAFIIVFLALASAVLFGTFTVLNIPIQVLYSSWKLFLGEEVFRTMFYHTLFILMLSSFILIIIAKLSKNGLNWWKSLTITLMFCLFYVGSVFIYLTVGIPDLDSILRDVDNSLEPLGNLDCSDRDGFPVIGSEVTCTFEPELINYTTTINFTDSNNKFIRSDSSFNEIRFVIPENTSEIKFSIIGENKKGEAKNLEVTRKVSLIGEENRIERRETLVAYILGLLAVVLFSIPSMMSTLKDLSKE